MDDMAGERRRINRAMVEILERMICPDQADWSVQVAGEFLQIRFAAEDAERFHRLLFGQFRGTLAAGEDDDLEGYLFVNCFVQMLHEKARRSLEQANADPANP